MIVIIIFLFFLFGQDQNQYSFIVPQTGNFVCHSSLRTEYCKKKMKNNNKITIVKNKKYNLKK